jgi:hypothetical protein
LQIKDNKRPVFKIKRPFVKNLPNWHKTNVIKFLTQPTPQNILSSPIRPFERFFFLNQKFNLNFKITFFRSRAYASRRRIKAKRRRKTKRGITTAKMRYAVLIILQQNKSKYCLYTRYIVQC